MSWVARAPGIGPARCESNCRDARLSKESRPQNPSDHQQTISHEDLPCARLARRVPNPVTGRLRLRRSRRPTPTHRAGGGPGGARQREEDLTLYPFLLIIYNNVNALSFINRLKLTS